jgi:hypothetical protein
MLKHQVAKCRIPSSGMFRRVVHVKTDVSEEIIASIIKVKRIRELGIMLAATRNRSTLRTANIVPSAPILVTLMMEAILSSDTSVLT